MRFVELVQIGLVVVRVIVVLLVVRVVLGLRLHRDGRTVSGRQLRLGRLIEGVRGRGNVAAVVTGRGTVRRTVTVAAAVAARDRFLAYVGQTPAAEIGQPCPQRRQIDRTRRDTLLRRKRRSHRKETNINS